MINTKQVVPALVAVTLLSLAPAAEALAIDCLLYTSRCV